MASKIYTGKIIPSGCFIFCYEKLAIQILCFINDFLNVLHDIVGIILLSALDAFKTRNILNYNRVITKYGYICCCRLFEFFSTAI